MATVTVTKVAGNPSYYSDIYRQMVLGDAISFVRNPNEISGMKSIIDGIAAAELTMSVVYSANELSTGLMSPPQSVDATDMAPVAASAAAAGGITMRFPIATGGAAEVVLFAANAFPFKGRVLDSVMFVSSSPGASTCILRDQAGGGQTIATFDSGSTGRKVDAAVMTSTLITPGALVGLFLTRSLNTVVGEVVITLRAES